MVGFSLPKFTSKKDEVEVSPEPSVAPPTAEKNTASPGLDEKPNNGDDVELSTDVQEGVHKVEALASVWSKNDLIVAYIGIFVVFFILSLEQQTINNLSTYVTSAFAQNAMLSTVSVVSSVVGGVIRLPFAKMLDIWGRGEGYCVLLTILVLGLIMMASTNGISLYAAAQVFYWVGYDGMLYALDVFMADTSSLKNRATVFAFSTTPYIATTFAGPRIAQDFLDGPGWRWGHGVWTLIIPALSAPFIAIVFMNQHRAKKRGLLQRDPSGRNLAQSLQHYFWELDVIGLVLLCAAFVLILVPLSLASSVANKWKSASMITMEVIGVVCLIAFSCYEAWFAPVTFIPFFLLKDRTVLGACLVAMTLYISFYCWDSYFSTYLQVVFNLSVTNAGYVYNIYSIGSCFWAVVVGFMIRFSGKFKWTALCVGLPLISLGTGLMIHFRQPSSSIGYVIMSQIFIAFGGGTLVITEQLAVMSAAPHQNVAAVLAFIGLFSSIGGGVGAAISGAIWTNTIPTELERLLPDNLKSQALTIYGDITVQLSYPMGSEARMAIQEAFGIAQRRMCIAATAVLVIAWFSVLIWRDIPVKGMEGRKNVKGRVL